MARAWLGRLGATFLALLGILRGAGGVMLLPNGVAAAGEAARPHAPTHVIGVGLILVGLLCVTAGIVNLVRIIRPGLLLAALSLLAFLADGAINGMLLYGAPRMAGAIGTFIYAFIVMIFLFAGYQRPADTAVNRPS